MQFSANACVYLYRSGMGYHGNLLLRTSAGGQERQRYKGTRPNLVWGEGGEAQAECLILSLVWNIPYDGE